MAKQERYIQVGVTALRDPATGDFLPAIPLFVRAEDVNEEEEKKLATDIGKLLAAKMRKYKESCEKAGVRI
ncbi:MAG: hypothetical protein E7322_05790 [Clostridiales bacterium]|nr:hypothetical protein [Clostridiales bacterium]